MERAGSHSCINRRYVYQCSARPKSLPKQFLCLLFPLDLVSVHALPAHPLPEKAPGRSSSTQSFSAPVSHLFPPPVGTSPSTSCGSLIDHLYHPHLRHDPHPLTPPHSPSDPLPSSPPRSRPILPLPPVSRSLILFLYVFECFIPIYLK